MPLVKEARTALPTMLTYSVGTLAGAAVTGILIGTAATGLQSALSPPERAALVAIGAALLLSADLRASLFQTPSLRRQTCSTWYRRFGPTKTFLIWGFDLGLGFSTIRVSSLFWVVALAMAAGAPPRAAPALMLAYGLALPVSVLVLFMREGMSERVNRSALALAGPMRRASLIVLVAFALSIVTSLVAT
jgi:cytochrome c biogenesis protein CcdA